MRRMKTALLSAVLGCASPAMAVAQGTIGGPLSLEIRAEPNGTIVGTIRNSGPEVARDVRLLVRHIWLWKNERNPGAPTDNPGRSAYYEVGTEVPPGGETQFRYVPDPPLPQRADGTFTTTAEIVGFTEGGGQAPPAAGQAD